MYIEARSLISVAFGMTEGFGVTDSIFLMNRMSISDIKVRYLNDDGFEFITNSDNFIKLICICGFKV